MLPSVIKHSLPWAGALFASLVLTAATRIVGLDQSFLWYSHVAAGLVAAAAVLLVMRMTQSGHRHLAVAVGSEIDHVMIGAAETAFFIESVKTKVEQDVDSTGEIVSGTEQNIYAVEAIANSAEQASSAAAQVREVSRVGRQEIGKGLERINQAHGEAEAASGMMAELKKTSRQISGITETINEIAARTNLLALNAAIEAARAGEYGRAFAVVAKEVRQLALRTREATEEIGTMVQTMNGKAERAAGGMDMVTATIKAAADNVKQVHVILGGIENSATDSEGEIQGIATASRENVARTRKLASLMLKMREGMLATVAALPHAAASAMQLAEKGEHLFKSTVDSGAATSHDSVRKAAQLAAVQIEKIFSDAIAAGQITQQALFDRHYTPIAHTNPQKHSSQFDSFTDHVLPGLQESILEAMPQVAYAGAVDSNGYFPTHNRKFSQPLTGNYDKDLVNNRTKRIFTDRTGTRCGSNTEPFLLQTYKRDTGEVMHDLSAPIYVSGRHWGSFRIGYRSVASK